MSICIKYKKITHLTLQIQKKKKDNFDDIMLIFCTRQI